MLSVEEIERAIGELAPEERAELLARLERQKLAAEDRRHLSVFEHGLGLFGSPEDAALLDEVVREAYEARRQPSKRTPPD